MDNLKIILAQYLSTKLLNVRYLIVEESLKFPYFVYSFNEPIKDELGFTVTLYIRGYNELAAIKNQANQLRLMNQDFNSKVLNGNIIVYQDKEPEEEITEEFVGQVSCSYTIRVFK